MNFQSSMDMSSKGVREKQDSEEETRQRSTRTAARHDRLYDQNILYKTIFFFFFLLSSSSLFASLFSSSRLGRTHSTLLFR